MIKSGRPRPDPAHRRTQKRWSRRSSSTTRRAVPALPGEHELMLNPGTPIGAKAGPGGRSAGMAPRCTNGRFCPLGQCLNRTFQTGDFRVALPPSDCKPLCWPSPSGRWQQPKLRNCAHRRRDAGHSPDDPDDDHPPRRGQIASAASSVVRTRPWGALYLAGPARRRLVAASTPSTTAAVGADG